jgi:hypothetical protein
MASKSPLDPHEHCFARRPDVILTRQDLSRCVSCILLCCQYPSLQYSSPCPSCYSSSSWPLAMSPSSCTSLLPPAHSAAAESTKHSCLRPPISWRKAIAQCTIHYQQLLSVTAGREAESHRRYGRINKRATTTKRTTTSTTTRTITRVLKLATHPSPSKVDKNDIAGRSVRSTRLADQEKRAKAPRVSWVSGR